MFLAALIISLPLVLAEEYRIDYDQNGNIIYDQESNVYREYNELNQLSRTRLNNASGTILQEYTYDPLKERIFIKDEFYSNGSLKSSTYYFDDDYIVIQNSSGTYNETYIYQDGILVGYEDVDGKKRYVLPDHEGSAHIVLEENGNVLEENLFSPFAEPLEGVKKSRFSYEAREYDDLVQDYDFRFRKYLPHIRIFGKPDDEINDPYNPQYLNRYSFELNNPMKYQDEDGHFTFLPYIIAGAVVGTINTIEYVMTHEDRNFWEGAGYFGAGFVEGALSLANPFSAITGGVISQAIENKIDDKKITEGVVQEGIISGVTFGLDEYLKLFPETKEWLIKKPLSYLTTKTGLKFISNIAGEEVASRAGQYWGNYLRIANQNNAVGNANQVNNIPRSGPNTSSGYYRISSGGYETISGGRKIGIGSGGTTYNIPSSATYSPGFGSQLGSGNMKGGKKGGRR